MSVARERLGDWLSDLGMAVLGIIVAMIPLALWVAWTEFLFVMVLAVGAIALVLIYMMAESGSSVAGDDRVPDKSIPRIRLSDEFIEELHRLYPLIYHHGRRGGVRFRKSMDRLLSLTNKSAC